MAEDSDAVERIFAELDAETAEIPPMDAAQVAYATRAVQIALAKQPTDKQVRQHHRYLNLWEDFQTVEKDLRDVALLVGHHYNSLRPVLVGPHYNSIRPVAPVVEAALAKQSLPNEDDRLRVERVAFALLHQRYATTDEKIAEWRDANNTSWKIAIREARAAIAAITPRDALTGEKGND